MISFQKPNNKQFQQDCFAIKYLKRLSKKQEPGVILFEQNETARFPNDPTSPPRNPQTLNPKMLFFQNKDRNGVTQHAASSKKSVFRGRRAKRKFLHRKQPKRTVDFAGN